MATLTICRKRHTQSSPYSAFSEELSRPSSQQRAAKRTLGHKHVPGLYLGDANNSDKDVLWYDFEEELKINVDSDEAGIGWHLEWVRPVAEIAVFERCDPQDPEYTRLKPVGVYPVIDGWAYINLLEVAGRGQDFDSPLYIAPGSAVMKRLGWGLERMLNSLNFVKAT